MAFKFQKNGLFYCEYCQKELKLNEEILKNTLKSNNHLKAINNNIEKLFKRNNKIKIEVEEKKNNKPKEERSRDEKGRFISSKKTETKQKESSKTARETIKENKTEKEKLNINLKDINLEKPLEVTGEAYYKAYEEIKSNLFEPFKNIVGGIKRFIPFKKKTKENTNIYLKESPKTGVLQKYKNLLLGQKTKENTTEYRSFIKENETENLKQNEEQTKLLEKLKKENSGTVFAFLLRPFLKLLKPLQKVLFKLLKIFPVLFGLLEVVGKKFFPNIIKNKAEKVRTKNKSKGNTKKNKGNVGVDAEKGVLKAEKDFEDNSKAKKAVSKSTTGSDTEVIKTVTKDADKDIAKTATKDTAKEIAKITAKDATKASLKKIPLASIFFGLVFGAQRAWRGDWTGAGLEMASGVAGTFPGIGTGASAGIDSYLLARDLGYVKDGKSNQVSDYYKLTKQSPDIKATKIVTDTYSNLEKYTLPKQKNTIDNNKTFSPEILKVLNEQTTILRNIAEKDYNINIENKEIKNKQKDISVNTNNTIIYNPIRQYEKGLK